MPNTRRTTLVLQLVAMAEVYSEEECQFHENESLLEFLSFDSPEQLQPQENVTVDQHFHLFPKLPIELRLQIWREALPKARNVYLGVQCCMRRPGAELPVTRMVLRESREETLRHYIIISQLEADGLIGSIQKIAAILFLGILRSFA
jgi:hypothetical protein